MNKKVIVFGGGTGMSYLLRGLKQYPLDITAIVTVCDDGKSTGILREEFITDEEFIKRFNSEVRKSCKPKN